MKKILIAEDDSFLSDIYKAKFSKKDWEVKIAKDGDETLLLIDKFEPDLVILDIIMPKKNGIEVLKELKQSKKINSLPVIIASNLDQGTYEKQAFECGAKEFFIKSNISVNELMSLCQKYLT